LRRPEPALRLSAGIMADRAVLRSHPGHGHTADGRWLQRLLFAAARPAKQTRRGTGGAAGIESEAARALSCACGLLCLQFEIAKRKPPRVAIRGRAGGTARRPA